MSGYGVFVIVVLVIYALYYAANIAYDLYGKELKSKSDSLEIEVDQDAVVVDDDEAETIHVSETATGFAVGDAEYKSALTVSSGAMPEDSEVNDINVEVVRESPAQKAMSNIEDSLEEVSVTIADGCMIDDMEEIAFHSGYLGGREITEITPPPHKKIGF